MIGAGNETRTRDPDLGKVVLYQLSYSRNYLKTAVPQVVACATVREPNYKSSHSNCKGFFVTVRPFAQKLSELPILAAWHRAGDAKPLPATQILKTWLR